MIFVRFRKGLPFGIKAIGDGKTGVSVFAFYDAMTMGKRGGIPYCSVPKLPAEFHQPGRGQQLNLIAPHQQDTLSLKLFESTAQVQGSGVRQFGQFTPG